jgi:hypothetical protein
VPGTYIPCTGKSGVDVFVPVADRARERGWPVYELATDRNPLSKDADRTALLDLLLQIVSRGGGARGGGARRHRRRLRPTRLSDNWSVGAPAGSILPGANGHAIVVHDPANAGDPTSTAGRRTPARCAPASASSWPTGHSPMWPGTAP